MNEAFLRFGDLDPVVAVFAFLVISGYSIAHSITTKPEGFYWRRARRIYPLYAIAVALTLVPFIFAGPVIHAIGGDIPAPTMRDLLGNLLFFQGFVVHPLYANGPLWTLAVEVFCYALAPLFIRLPRWALLTIAGMSWVAFCAFPKLHLTYYSQLLFGLPVLFLVWAWLGGFILYQNRHDYRFQMALLCGGTLAFLVNRLFLARFALFTYILSICVIIFADRIRIPDRFAKLMHYGGELSYPLYVFHAPIMIMLYASLGVRNAAVLIALACFAAVIFFHGVDAQIRHRRASAMRLAAPRP